MALRNEAGETIGGLETFQDLSLIQQLNRAISNKYTFADMIGKDGVMQQIFEILPVVADSEANVLVEGPHRYRQGSLGQNHPQCVTAQR